VALRYGRAGARREETVDVDQVLLVLVSGLASGAVYGLMGLGLVIIIGRRTW
jgi:branched-chain amino acid transport system permease protein